MDNTLSQVPIDVSVVIDADWPEWRSALEDIRREYGDEGVRALHLAPLGVVGGAS